MKPLFVIAAALLIGPFAHAEQPMTQLELINQLTLQPPKPTDPPRGICKLGGCPPEPRKHATPSGAWNDPISPRNPDHAPSVSLKVEFETGSDKLTPAAVKTLDMLGRALSSSTLASYHFRIEGHTDAVGNPDLNASLSARRADTVADYIERHYSIDRSRLTSIGMGDSQMLIPTAAGVPEPRNRRVQIVNTGS
jgi:outer membrane protein OmpA-like peptidoglycan-associated protein